MSQGYCSYVIWAFSVMCFITCYGREWRIYNGIDAKLGEFPSLVSLTVDKDYKHVCGGTLINRKAVLTAAHCFNNLPKPITRSYLEERYVRAIVGRHNIHNLGPGEKDHHVKHIVIHVDFSKFNSQCDIAIVHLSGKGVDESEHVRYATLASPHYRVPPRTNGTIAGWGDVDSNGTWPKVLQKGTVQVITPFQCSLQWDDTLLLNPKSLCVILSPSQACSGDSGGPLYTKETITLNDESNWNDSRSPRTAEVWVQHGVTSFGTNEGCEHWRASVFVSVSEFREWIAVNSDLKFMSVTSNLVCGKLQYYLMWGVALFVALVHKV